MTPRFALFIVASLAVVGLHARAGWVTIKNETTQPVIVQETCVVNNQTRRGKPIKLMPGETLREFQSAPGSKTVQVLEPGLLFNKLLTKSDLEWKADDKSFVIRKDGDAVKVLTPTPAVALVTPVSAEKK